MKRILVVFLLGMTITGCSFVPYKGSCNKHGKVSYQDRLFIECTEYCSNWGEGLGCKQTIAELEQAEREYRAQDARNYAEALRAQHENLRRQDKITCSNYGFASNSEGMANCVMQEQSKREVAQQQRQQYFQQQQQQQYLQQQQQQYYQQQMNRPTTTTCNKDYFGTVKCETRK